MKDLINILSLILPFSNEIAGILCESDYKTFSNLYAQCIDPYLLDFRTQKLIPNKKICDDKKFYYKLFFDIIAIIGIILNICRNAIQNGYLDGVLSGINIMMLSFILPNLYLHKIVHYIITYFKIKNNNLKLIVGIFVVAIFFIVTLINESIIDKIFINDETKRMY